VGRGVNRSKVARIDWVGVTTDTPIAFEPFEGFNNNATGTGTDANGLTPLVDTWPTTQVNTSGASSFDVVSEGAGSAFAPGAKYDGAQALRCLFNDGGAPGPNPTMYVSRTFTGLPPSTAVVVRCACGVGFHNGGSPASTPIGMQIGAASAYLGAFDEWETLEIDAVTDVSGQLTVKLGVFDFTADGSSLERLIFWDALSISTPLSTSGGLRFYCDVGESYPQPRKNSTMLDGPLGRLRALAGIDELFKCTARRIPAIGGTQDDGATITGWDDADGWQQFLIAARDQQVLTFYPDASNLAVSYPVLLVEPIDAGPPDKDGQKRFKQDLTLRSLGGPVLGY